MNITSKQRSFLKGLAMKLDPVFQIGKDGLTDELLEALSDVLDKRELIKVNVLKNCDEDKKELAEAIAGRTKSMVVQVIGSKIVLFKYQHNSEKRKIEI